MADSLEAHASRPRLGLNFSAMGDGETTTPTPTAAATPTPIVGGTVDGLGGMTFGKALSPYGSQANIDVINGVAAMNERAADAALFTRQGQEALKRVPDQLKMQTAGKYAELFAVGGVEPTAEQQTKIERLGALERHQAKTAGMSFAYQTAPTTVLSEISKLRGELDKDTLQIRTQAARAEFVKAKLAQTTYEGEQVNADVYAELSKQDNAALLSSLRTGNFKQFHPEATRDDVLELIKDRRDNKDPDMTEPLSAEQRAYAVNQRLGMLRPSDRETLMGMLQTDGPMAFVPTPENPVIATDKETPEQLAAARAQFDATRARNERIAMFSSLMGGIQPTLDEVVSNLAKHYEMMEKTGAGPATIAITNRNALDLTKIESTRIGDQVERMNGLGISDQSQYAIATMSQLNALMQQQLISRDPARIKAYQDERAKLLKDREDSVGETLKAITDDKGVRQSLRNFIDSGEFIRHADGMNGLAYLGARGEIGTGTVRPLTYTVTDPSGMTKTEQMNIGSAANDALKIITSNVSDAARQLDSADDLAKQAMLKSIQNNKDKKDKGIKYDPQYDDEAWAGALKAMANSPIARKAQEAYTTKLYTQGLAMALNDAFGPTYEARNLYNQIISIDQGGNVSLKDQFLTQRQGDLTPRPDLTKVIDFLYEKKALSVIDTLRNQLRNKDYKDKLFSTLQPVTPAEKATFSYLFGRDVSVIMRKEASPIIATSDHNAVVNNYFIRDVLDRTGEAEAGAAGRKTSREEQLKQLMQGLAAQLP